MPSSSSRRLSRQGYVEIGCPVPRIASKCSPGDRVSGMFPRRSDVAPPPPSQGRGNIRPAPIRFLEEMLPRPGGGGARRTAAGCCPVALASPRAGRMLPRRAGAPPPPRRRRRGNIPRRCCPVHVDAGCCPVAPTGHDVAPSRWRATLPRRCDWPRLTQTFPRRRHGGGIGATGQHDS